MATVQEGAEPPTTQWVRPRFPAGGLGKSGLKNSAQGKRGGSQQKGAHPATVVENEENLVHHTEATDQQMVNPKQGRTKSMREANHDPPSPGADDTQGVSARCSQETREWKRRTPSLGHDGPEPSMQKEDEGRQGGTPHRAISVCTRH